MPKRIKTAYPGVYCRLTKRRDGGRGVEKVYYIVFKKKGKVYEEKAGRQFEDNMTPAKAALIRGERIEGKRLSRKEIKEIELGQKWTIERLWEEYKKNNQNLKGLAIDENRFKNHIAPHFTRKQPKDLAPIDIDTFRIKLMKERKPGTVKNVLELLRRVIMFGKKKRLCPGIDFTIEMPKVNNLKTEDLTPEQLVRLLRAIEEEPNVQVANLVKLALFTGMRRGELFSLKWADLDFRHGFITIRDPKGGQDQKIPINDQARVILESHPKKDSPYVFPGRSGNKRTDINKQVVRIKQRARLPKSFRALHGLRHVYASMLASSGQVDLYTLQKLLTHKSPSMTQRYAHLRDDALKKASSLAGELLAQHADNSGNKRS